MNSNCLKHCLTAAESKQFEEQGYVIIENALTSKQVDHYSETLDKIYADKVNKGIRKEELAFLCDILHEDDSFLDLIDHHATFPKAWGVLGWNIYNFHTHLSVIHRQAPKKPDNVVVGWHRDGARLNRDLKIEPTPRFSAKIAYLISDASEPDRANLHIIPGSHLAKNPDIKHAIQICAKAGTAILFDRRLVHAQGFNYSDVVRKALFFGYCYRWIRPKDNMTVGPILEHCDDPIRRQLLGDGVNANHYYDPGIDLPLRQWLLKHRKKDAA